MAEWIGQLGSIYDYEGVPYVEVHSDGDVRCDLCGTGWMPRRQRIAHFRGARHHRRYKHVEELERKAQEEEAIVEAEKRAVQQAISERLDATQSLQARAEKLGHPSWQNAILAGLFKHVKDEDFGLDQIKSMLKTYEQMERLSLLELAVWKASLCEGAIFRTTEDIHEQAALNPQFDASSYMQARRIAGGCDVIVPAVAHFLYRIEQPSSCCGTSGRIFASAPMGMHFDY